MQVGLLRAKFSQHEGLRAQLLETVGREIVNVDTDACEPPPPFPLLRPTSLGLQAVFRLEGELSNVSLGSVAPPPAPPPHAFERCVNAGAGMAAAGGIATGQNHVGKALMAVRQEFLDAAA